MGTHVKMHTYSVSQLRPYNLILAIVYKLILAALME